MTSPPSRNPTDNDSLVGLFNVVLQKYLQGNIDDQLPAQVVAYNRTTNVAQIQPLIPLVTTDGIVVKRAQVMSVPVFRYGGGNCVLNMAPTAGDLGWLKANDRDISIFKQSYSQAVPNTARMHSFADAMFYPDKMQGVVTPSAHASDATIQSVDGTSYAALITSNAILDLNSTTKAFALPAMTTAQKNAIPAPRAGFMVFDTTEGGVSVYNGTVWS